MSRRFLLCMRVLFPFPPLQPLWQAAFYQCSHYDRRPDNQCATRSIDNHRTPLRRKACSVYLVTRASSLVNSKLLNVAWHDANAKVTIATLRSVSYLDAFEIWHQPAIGIYDWGLRRMRCFVDKKSWILWISVCCRWWRSRLPWVDGLHTAAVMTWIIRKTILCGNPRKDNKHTRDIIPQSYMIHVYTIIIFVWPLKRMRNTA